MRSEETFDKMTQAYVRKPGKNFAEGVCPAVGIPDYEQAALQHQKYIAALMECGVDVQILKTDPLFPDGCFVNDMAIITENLAVICNFIDNSPRQGEQRATAEILSKSKFLKFVTAPGYLDGGDVLQIRDHFYIGLSDHTNHAGAEQLAEYLREFGYESSILDLREENIVRLKTAVTYLGNDRILIREELARNFAFLEYEKIIVPRHEKGAANALMLNGRLLMPAGYPQTEMEIKMLGIPYTAIDISEFEKMNGGLSCLSLRMPRVEKGNVILMTSLKRKVA